MPGIADNPNLQLKILLNAINTIKKTIMRIKKKARQTFVSMTSAADGVKMR
jgi:hypothetical protein